MARTLTHGAIYRLPDGTPVIAQIVALDQLSPYSGYLYRQDNWPPARLPDWVIERETGAILEQDGTAHGSIADLRDTGIILTASDAWPEVLE